MLLLTAMSLTGVAAGCDERHDGPAPQAERLDAIGSGLAIAKVVPGAAGKALFERACVACHTVGGGPRIGPDLAGLYERRDPAWIARWMADPMGMTKTDPVGKELLKTWNGVQMPPTGFTDTETADVLAYIRAAGGVGAGDVAEGAPSTPTVSPGGPPVGAPVDAILTSPPLVPPATGRTAPAKVVVHLEVRELSMPISEGVEYTFWTFGGTVPGKFIRVREGDTVEFHLNNHPDSKMPHNIDLHAVTGPGGGATSSFTAPGHSSQFTFRTLNPGLYIYHCATAPVGMHIANGMYGLIYVEPATPLPPVDREYYVVQGDFYTVGKYREKGQQPFDMQKAIEENATYVLLNGSEGALVGDNALKARVGETVRLYVGNGGPNLVSSFHVIGEIFDRVYTEGGTVAQRDVQTTLIPAGGSTIVEFRVDVPGTYVLVDHSIFRAFNKGALGLLVVEGEEDVAIYSGKEIDEIYIGDKAEGADLEPDAVAVASAAFAAGELTIDQQIAAGKLLYQGTCSTCHQNDGKGIPGVFPPLAGSDYLLADSRRATEIVLNGLSGPVTVNGELYNSVMAPLSNLNDDEIAHILTYVNNSMGNKGDRVMPGDVAKVRATTTRPPGAGH